MGDASFRHVTTFQTHPAAYRHWSVTYDGPVATVTLDIDEGDGLHPGYELKQNSYDLGVDLELRDLTERMRFEHPEVRAVVFTSAQPKVFCAGANIGMLGSSTHHFKVNFCKYTNETRVGIEEASAESGQRYLCALNGTAAGGGYELALACDEIYLIDDRSSAVSLPEVPLLGVLPGTGGLTRLVDKRQVRRDLADLFCTKAEGFKSRDAVRYDLVDGAFKRSKWEAGIADVAAKAAAASPTRETTGISLPEIPCDVTDTGDRTYRYVRVELRPDERVARITLTGPDSDAPTSPEALRAEGADTWSMRMFRELNDAMMHLRFNHPDIGLWLWFTRGDADAVLAHDAALASMTDDWFAHEIRCLQGRILRRVDNNSRSMFAILDAESCFAGSLFEFALAADRSFMLDDPDAGPTVRVTAASGGALPTSNGRTRLDVRFAKDAEQVAAALGTGGRALDAGDAVELGLVTLAPDDLDWDDEIRIAIEERASLSPDALTGMEQNLRVVGAETCETKIYGRLSAWQNWIFQRPNAVGTQGALTLYGHPEQPRFDWGRT